MPYLFGLNLIPFLFVILRSVTADSNYLTPQVGHSIFSTPADYGSSDSNLITSSGLTMDGVDNNDQWTQVADPPFNDGNSQDSLHASEDQACRPVDNSQIPKNSRIKRGLCQYTAPSMKTTAQDNGNKQGGPNKDTSTDPSTDNEHLTEFRASTRWQIEPNRKLCPNEFNNIPACAIFGHAVLEPPSLFYYTLIMPHPCT